MTKDDDMRICNKKSGIDPEHWQISTHLMQPAQISGTNEHSGRLFEWVQY